jgi:DNA-binding transcriptional LysR family regulator
MQFRDLNFPFHSTAAWLEDVDVALLYAPTPHPDVESLVLRSEPRVAVLSREHPFAEREQLTVADVIDETFSGNHPSVEPVRAGFWRLDEERGAPARVTSDQASNPQEVLAVVASGRAIWTAAASTVTHFLNDSSPVIAVPLSDAPSVPLALAWRRDVRNPHVPELAAIARERAEPTAG